MISEDDIKKLANLARLEIEPSYVTTLTGQLNNILNHIEQLNEVDTKDVKPLSHVHETINIFRDDKVIDGLDNSNPPKNGTLALDEALAGAPDKSGRYFKVPLVIE